MNFCGKLVKYCLSILYLLCLSIPAWAQDSLVVNYQSTNSNTHLLTLSDAIYLALRYNPNVRNAEIQRVIDKFNLRLAKYSYELQYALTGNINYSNESIAGIHST